MESRFAGFEDTIITHLYRTGEGNNATQIDFRALFSADGVYTIRTILKAVVYNYCRTGLTQDLLGMREDVVV